MSTTIRVDEETHRRLREISRESGKQLIDTVRDAAAALELVRFATSVRSELDSLRSDKKAWATYLLEAEATNVSDGIT